MFQMDLLQQGCSHLCGLRMVVICKKENRNKENKNKVDRNEAVRERGYTVSMYKLIPPEACPKNDVIVGVCGKLHDSIMTQAK